MKARAFLGVYLAVVWTLLYMFCVTPKEALAVQYARVIQRSAQLVVLQANRNAVVSAVASTALAPSPASVAIRMVAGPIGWAALGVSVGLALHQTYYSSTQLEEVKQAAAPVGMYQVDSGGGQLLFPTYNSGTPNPSYPEAQVQLTANGYCGQSGADPSYPHDWSVGPFRDSSTFFYQGPAFTGGAIVLIPPTIGNASYYFCHRTGQPGTVAPWSGAPTQQQVAAYVDSLPANDPKSIESHTSENGLAVPVTPADDVTTVPVNADQVGTAVVPKPVPAGASVVKDPENPPSGAQDPVTNSQDSTTTTTQNPDGSTTEQSTANVSCVFGEHDGRTMATVFEEHKGVWQTSGLLSLLATFQALTWPSMLPTITLPSGVFGNQTINFNDWSGIFLALRTLLIATTTFVAVRYVFAGGGN
ncbi:MAG: hypothetical protein UZ03_NOB001001881 [Nitrospira sp. OLB3]|nr:MAG: hypothetical protein UZ03_NOB001001881 [Nitrospira sp. OLB3]